MCECCQPMHMACEEEDKKRRVSSPIEERIWHVVGSQSTFTHIAVIL